MEQFTCVQSGHHCHDSYSLPCDDPVPYGHYALVQAFRDAESVLEPYLYLLYFKELNIYYLNHGAKIGIKQ